MEFPTSPAVNQVVTVGNRSWRWNGTSWEVTHMAPTTGASVAGWTKVVDKSGASLTGFTQQAGTWTTDGSVISSATNGILSIDEFDVRAPFYITVDVKVVTTGGSNLNNGFAGPYAGGSSMSNFNRTHIQWAGTNTVSVTTDNVAERASAAFTPSLDTWYTLSALYTSTTEQSVFINGTSYLVNVYAPVNSGQCKRMSLLAAGSNVKWRNLAIWVPTHLATLLPTFNSSVTFTANDDPTTVALIIGLE